MRQLSSHIRRFALEQLSSAAPRTIVDYGCGTRPYESLFADANTTYIAADFAGNPIAETVLTETGALPLTDGIADIVLSIQVLEHVVDTQRYLAECRRVLRPGGALLLSTHGTWTYHPFPQDLRRWTWRGLLHDVEKAGFVIERWDGCMGPLAYTAQLRLQLVRGFLWRLGLGGRLVVPILSAMGQLWMMALERITPREVSKTNAAVYVLSGRRCD